MVIVWLWFVLKGFSISLCCYCLGLIYHGVSFFQCSGWIVYITDISLLSPPNTIHHPPTS